MERKECKGRRMKCKERVERERKTHERRQEKGNLIRVEEKKKTKNKDNESTEK